MNAGDPPRQKELFPNPSNQGLPEPPSGGSDFSVRREGRGDNWSVVLVDKLVGAQNAHCIPSVN